jgi:methionine sulfoxide reductase heme-binding subunit
VKVHVRFGERQVIRALTVGGVSAQRTIRSLTPPLGGNSGSWRYRLLCFHMPLAVVSGVVLSVFMTFPAFDVKLHSPGDIFSGSFPEPRSGNHAGPMGHGNEHGGPMRHGGRHRMESMRHHGGEATNLTPNPEQIRHRSSIRQLTVATGYVALGLFALTLLIGLLRRQNPVSNYLRRDVGIWTAFFSTVHVVLGLHVHGSGRIHEFVTYFFTSAGRPRVNSFGLGNWTGLAALLIVLGLLATSNAAALRKLKAKPWKWIQRQNYVLLVLVILHAYFYGALLRPTSPYTALLVLSIVGVFLGQAAGIWLWRRKFAPQQPREA